MRPVLGWVALLKFRENKRRKETASWNLPRNRNNSWLDQYKRHDMVHYQSCSWKLVIAWQKKKRTKNASLLAIRFHIYQFGTWDIPYPWPAQVHKRFYHAVLIRLSLLTMMKIGILLCSLKQHQDTRTNIIIPKWRILMLRVIGANNQIRQQHGLPRFGVRW